MLQRIGWILAVVAGALCASCAYAGEPGAGARTLGELPAVSVRVTAPRMSAREIDELVARPLEMALIAVPGIGRTIVRCEEGSALLLAVRQPGADADLVAAQVKNAVDKAKGKLPVGAAEPVIYNYNVLWPPDIVFALVHEAGQDRADLAPAAEMAKQMLEQLPGMGACEPVGAPAKPELVIQIDRAKCAELGLTVAHVASVLEVAIFGERRELNAGDNKAVLQIPGTAKGEDIEKLVVINKDGNAVRVANIATVRYERTEGMIQRVDGQAAALVNVFVQPGASAGKVRAACEAALKEKLPKGLCRVVLLAGE